MTSGRKPEMQYQVLDNPWAYWNNLSNSCI
jgi:hypothetical protein